MKKILVTGATGFIGNKLCRRLLSEGYSVIGTIRSLDGKTRLPPGIVASYVGDIDRDTNWLPHLTDVDVVVHLASIVHRTCKESKKDIAAYREVNTYGTEKLAYAAAKSKVRRFIFMSTIKVNGEETFKSPFTEDDRPNPKGAYAISKYEAEQRLMRIHSENDMDVVIVRSPLVYGPGVGGNFFRLLKLVDKGFPLPLRNIHNKRSLISVGNLVDLIIRCIEKSEAAGEVFFATNGKNISTPDLINRLAKLFGKSLILIPFPKKLLQLTSFLSGKSGLYKRLCGSLEIDPKKTKDILGWTAPNDINESFAQTVDWFMKEHCKK